MIYVYIFAALILLVFIWSFIEQKIIVKKEYTINLKDNGIDSEGVSFVLLSDIHNTGFGKGNKALLQKIFKVNPDFVIIAGDLITKRKPCYPSKAYNLIKDLSNSYPVYFAYGNHEQRFEDMEHNRDENGIPDNELVRSWTVFKSKLKEMGVFILDNNTITLKIKNNTLNITGLSIDYEYYKSKSESLTKDYITDKIGKRSREGCQILIAHNPVYFKDYILWGADLVLSGHIHGGLIRFPFIGGIVSPQVKLFPKYDAGLFEDNGRYMVVSRGLGTHSFMPRIFNPPELVVINLKAD